MEWKPFGAHVPLCALLPLKPSLVEWKQAREAQRLAPTIALETFLGGMETCKMCPAWSFCFETLETFLGGMETVMPVGKEEE